jgi:hypothetical protein
LVGNSGNFPETLPMLWREALESRRSPFWSFLHFSDWLFGRVGRNHSIALTHLAEMLFEYLTGERGVDAPAVATAVWRDFRAGGRRDGPDFLRPFLSEAELRGARRDLPDAAAAPPPRQARHLNAATRHSV